MINCFSNNKNSNYSNVYIHGLADLAPPNKKTETAKSFYSSWKAASASNVALAIRHQDLRELMNIYPVESVGRIV